LKSELKEKPILAGGATGGTFDQQLNLLRT
jgi:hypothetical protein